MNNMGVGGALQAPQGQTMAGGGMGGSLAQPGQQLTPENMQYNANNANQNAMAAMQGAMGFNQSGFNQVYNPYIQNVVDANTAQANRNFNQQTAPALQSQFGMSGQPGSARAMATMEQANRDMNQNLNWQNSALMQQGYQSAMDNYARLQQQAQQGALGMGQLGQMANQMGQSQTLLPANYLGIMSGALGNIKTNTMSQSTGSTSNPYYSPYF
jgi:hypothetical protein